MTSIAPPTTEPRAARPGIIRGLARPRSREATWVLPATPRRPGPGRRAVPRQPHGQRLRQRLLLGRRLGRVAGLVGLVLRVDRSLELHHRRQAAAGDHGPRPVGPAVRPQLGVHPRPAGTHGCGERRAPDGDGPADVRGPGVDHRRPRHGPHAGGGPDLPVQQPRRAADPAPRRRGLRFHPRPRERPASMGGPRRRARRPRLRDQAAPGVPRPAGLCDHVRDRRSGLHPASDRRARRRPRGRGRQQRLVDRRGRAHPGRIPAVHRRQHQRLRPGPGPRI